jgi:cytochrome c-type biogenesis protein CcmH
MARKALFAAGTAAPTKLTIAAIFVLIALLFSMMAFAVPATAPSGPNTLPPKLEMRYQKLTAGLRCPVCQNETIAVSDSVVAKDLRRIVREKLLAGESDRQIRQYMISRYGLFAVYDPPIALSTWALWFGPVVLLLIAALVAVFAVRRRRLSPDRGKASELRQ